MSVSVIIFVSVIPVSVISISVSASMITPLDSISMISTAFTAILFCSL